MMKRIFQFGLLAALVFGTVYLWWRVPIPCETPLQYDIGTFDERFGLSRVDFLRHAEVAESLWEQALGKELFRYVPGAVFKMNLIFDERQERTLESQKLDASLEQTKASQETLAQKQDTIRARYEAAHREYERMLESFKKRLNAYNAEVEKWNRRGGAPQDEYRNLQDVARVLEIDAEKLEAKRQVLNRLANDVNAFSKQQVAVVEQYNEQVTQYVDRYGTSGEFDQGDYVGKEINVYQYDDIPHLQAVLVHEFGHALGLGHGTEPTSIMYHLMKEQSLDPLRLTDEDRAMLLEQCSQTLWDVVFERIGIAKQWLKEHEDKKGFLGL